MPVDSSLPWWKKDASVFAALLAIAVISFAITYVFSHTFQRRQDALSRRWYQRGEADLKSARPQQAVADLRTALRFAPDNMQYRLRLAQALAAANETDQAIPYFLNLWEGQPGNALFSLELARLYARQGDASRTVRFYNAAVYGVWDRNPIEERRKARLEYIRFLVNKQMVPQSRAEAIALAAAVPPLDIDGRFTAADTLLLTGEYDRALRAYQELIPMDRRRAALGAGMSASRLEWFGSAAKYLGLAVKEGVSDPDVASALERAQLVLSVDPTDRKLSASERSKRLKDAFSTAGARLVRCGISKGQSLDAKTVGETPSNELQSMYAEWVNTGKTTHNWRRVPTDEKASQLMDLVGRIEQQTAKDCGPPDGKDWALLTISRHGDEVRK